MTESPELLNNQAIELAAQGDYKEAIACFKYAISLENQNHMLWFNMGLTYRDCGDLEQARKSLEQALTLSPYDEEVIENLALICHSMGHVEEAMEYCGVGLHININNAHLWNTMGVFYYGCAEYEDACEAFEHAVSIDPYYYDALYNLRDTYEQTGNMAGIASCDEKMKEIKGDAIQ